MRNCAGCLWKFTLFSFEGAPRGDTLSDAKWPVGQVVKTAASHAANGSSTLPRVTNYYAPLAQLVEHLTLNQGVQGSSP